MRIVVAHNFYQQPGGEDQVFAAEVDLLRRFGCEVETFELHNDAIERMSRPAALAATFWNRDSADSIRRLVARHRAEIIHFHNTFPLLSPAAWKAARDEGAAVVQTLHNFRFICPCALLFRDGATCERCVGRPLAWPGVRHRCYRGSRQATAVVAAMNAAHRAAGSWERLVDAYIAPSPSARAKLVEGGLPADRVVVKPNFVEPDPGVGTGAGGYACFVGRLSHEKGLETLLDAWRILQDRLELRIIGDGPLAPMMRDAVARQPNIHWLGRRDPAEAQRIIGDARFQIFPSRCYETFGRVIVEAFAAGTPVLASRHGAPADLIDHERTGLLFAPGDAGALADAVRTLLDRPETVAAMRAEARREYELRYTGRRNYELLMDVYARALRRRAAAPASEPLRVPADAPSLFPQEA